MVSSFLIFLSRKTKFPFIINPPPTRLQPLRGKGTLQPPGKFVKIIFKTIIILPRNRTISRRLFFSVEFYQKFYSKIWLIVLEISLNDAKNFLNIHELPKFIKNFHKSYLKFIYKLLVNSYHIFRKLLSNRLDWFKISSNLIENV